jgi:hypothetical protein
MRLATRTFAAAACLAAGLGLGPGARPALAQIDLGPAGTVGPAADVASYRPALASYYRRYRFFDARTRRYVDRYVLVRRTAIYDPSSGQTLVAEVPVRATSTRARAFAATSSVTGPRRAGVLKPRERTGP